MARNITITQALSELKVLDSRIRSSTRSLVLVAAKRKSETTIGGRSVEKFKQEEKSKLQQIEKLIENRSEIKRKVIKSNAETSVTIAGVVMTVAEALEYKSSIGYKIELRDRMNASLSDAIKRENLLKDELERKVSSMTDSAMQASGSTSKSDGSGIVEMITQLQKNMTPDFIDSVDGGLQARVEALDVEIDEFISNVDIIITISNASTIIRLEE